MIRKSGVGQCLLFDHLISFKDPLYREVKHRLNQEQYRFVNWDGKCYLIVEKEEGENFKRLT